MNYLVTGASRGIGLNVARRLAGAGFGVTLCARNTDLLQSQLEELPVVDAAQTHDIWSLDMADQRAVADMAGCPRPLNNYTGFINCAGIAGTGLFLMQSVYGIEKTLNVNLYAPMVMAKHIVRAMVRDKKSADIRPYKRHLIFMSSVLGTRGAAGSAVYSATKAGLEGFSRSLAREVGSRGIAVNCIAPGLVDTDMGRASDQKLAEQNVFPGLVAPDAVSDAVMYLLDSQSITGTTLTVDNGCSI